MDHKRNENTLKESKLDKFSKCKISLIQHIDRIQRNTIPTPLEN
jgi:hypothetical protein